MCSVPSCLKQTNFPCIAVVTVVVTEVVSDEDAVEVAVVVTVDVLGFVDTVLVIVLVAELVIEDVAVVYSHLVYSPTWKSVMARFNAAAVTAHFANGEPPLESFKNPCGLHSTVPNASSVYGVMSSMMLFSTAAPASHLSWSLKRSML